MASYLTDQVFITSFKTSQISRAVVPGVIIRHVFDDVGSPLNALGVTETQGVSQFMGNNPHLVVAVVIKQHYFLSATVWAVIAKSRYRAAKDDVGIGVPGADAGLSDQFPTP